MHYVLLLIYFSLICWRIPRAGFIARSGLGPNTTRLLFTLKVLAGFAIGWISLHYYGHKPSDNDYWKMNIEGWQEYQSLVHHPKTWFTDIFSSNYDHTGGFFSSAQSYWNDLKNNLVLKLVSIFNIFSRGDYYINSLFMNSLGFFGHVALFRIFSKIYPGKMAGVIAGTFLLPSMLYFSSGLHKDAVVFTCLSLLLYCMYSIIGEHKSGFRRIMTAVICAVLLLLTRSYVLILLLPALVAYAWSARRKINPVTSFAVTYLLAGLAFFTINKLLPAIDPPQTVVQKKIEFSATGFANTALPMNKLAPTFGSFAGNAPQALDHVLLRPYITEHPNLFISGLSVEIIIYLLIFFVFLISKRPKQPGRFQKPGRSFDNPFLWLCLFFTLTVYLNIGYIVNNIGAIARYRSLFLPLIITPLLAGIDWKMLFKRKRLKTA